jgi:hypothetical protein
MANCTGVTEWCPICEDKLVLVPPNFGRGGMPPIPKSPLGFGLVAGGGGGAVTAGSIIDDAQARLRRTAGGDLTAHTRSRQGRDS